MKFLFAILFCFLMPATALAKDLPVAAKDSDYRAVSDAEVKLGQLLFYDRVLSGTYRVSCGTCHNHDRASSNGFLLDPGKAPKTDDLAVNGLPLYDVFKPSSRHAPALFNIGAKEFTKLFSDGRVSGQKGAFNSPASEALPDGLRDVLAVQALFPAVTGDELVGAKVDSDLARAAHAGNNAVWEVLVARIRDLQDYLPYFQTAFPKVKAPGDIEIRYIANALSAFVATEWRSDQSPYDAYLRGNANALNAKQKRGMEVFYGEGQCGQCHSGTFQTDHKFHATASPLWRFDADLKEGVGEILRGRENVTGKREDLFRFRTPSLRNVALTAPYGLAGSHKTLDEFLNAHLDPAPALEIFINGRLKGGEKSGELKDLQKQLLAQNEMPDIRLSQTDVDAVLAFLARLSDPAAVKGRLGKPNEVPSSLALD